MINFGFEMEQQQIIKRERRTRQVLWAMLVVCGAVAVWGFIYFPCAC